MGLPDDSEEEGWGGTVKSRVSEVASGCKLWED